MYMNTTLASKHAECIDILINWFIWLLAEEMPVQLGQVRKKVGEGANKKNYVRRFPCEVWETICQACAGWYLQAVCLIFARKIFAHNDIWRGQYCLSSLFGMRGSCWKWNKQSIKWPIRGQLLDVKNRGPLFYFELNFAEYNVLLL